MGGTQKTDEKLQQFLLKTRLFDGFSEEELRGLLPQLHYRIIEIPANSVFVAGGEKIDQIQLIHRGEMVVSKLMESGEENLIEKLSPGYMVNVSVACSPSQINPFYVRTTLRTEVFEFPLTRLYQPNTISESDRTRLFQNISFHLANDNIRRQKKIDVLSVSGLRDRIIIFLQARADMMHQDEFRIPFNREEMANYLCVNRSALSHELSLMQQEGIIEFRKNRFKLLKK